VTFTYSFVGLPLALQAVRALGGDVERIATEAVSETAEWAKDEVFKLAPVDEDIYRHTIGFIIERTGDSVRARVGTGEPYGRRLEFGFGGRTDSRNRTYVDINLPIAHFGPVADRVPRELVRRMQRLA